MTILYPLYARGNRGRAADLLLFASNHPHWSTMDTGGLFPEAAAADRERLLAGNAPDFYPRLRAAAAA